MSLDAVPTWMNGLLRSVLGASAHSQRVRLMPLEGGVASDIYRIDASGTTFCVKRALPKLKVAADWRVPVERNRFEVEWLQTAASIVPKAVPRLLAHDPDARAFAMEWLPPERFPVWKTLLAEGTIVSATAARVGDVLGRLHAASAARADLASRFASDDLFHAIRLDPYLLAAGRAHPDLAATLNALVERTANTRRALVHGDFSPKNLLIGPMGPVILDAECAWYGDPAFDLAFVLNHLLLKGAWHHQWRDRYTAAFTSLVNAYRVHVGWEPRIDIEARTAALLPGLMLARVDGKSPVEYLDEAGRLEVRGFARERLLKPGLTLAEIASLWAAA